MPVTSPTAEQPNKEAPVVFVDAAQEGHHFELKSGRLAYCPQPLRVFFVTSIKFDWQLQKLFFYVEGGTHWEPALQEQDVARVLPRLAALASAADIPHKLRKPRNVSPLQQAPSFAASPREPGSAGVPSTRSLLEVSSSPSYWAGLPYAAKRYDALCATADAEGESRGRGGAGAAFWSPSPVPVSVNDFFVRMVTHGGSSQATFAISIIFLERLLERTGVPVTSHTVHRLLLANFMLAAKLHDDAHHGSPYYASMVHTDAATMNCAERAALSGLDFDIKLKKKEFVNFSCAILSGEEAWMNPRSKQASQLRRRLQAEHREEQLRRAQERLRQQQQQRDSPLVVSLPVAGQQQAPSDPGSPPEPSPEGPLMEGVVTPHAVRRRCAVDGGSRRSQTSMGGAARSAPSPSLAPPPPPLSPPPLGVDPERSSSSLSPLPAAALARLGTAGPPTMVARLPKEHGRPRVTPPTTSHGCRHEEPANLSPRSSTSTVSTWSTVSTQSMLSVSSMPRPGSVVLPSFLPDHLPGRSAAAKARRDRRAKEHERGEREGPSKPSSRE